jgi:hypothetical protein
VAESVVVLTDRASRRSTLLPDATAQALRGFSRTTLAIPPSTGTYGRKGHGSE